MKRDERSFRVALVADRYVNPQPGGVDAVAVAAETGWGVIQLPAGDYPDAVAERLMYEVAEQAEEFTRHGYDLVLVGHCEGLAEALARVGLALPENIRPVSSVQLLEFLQSRPFLKADRG